MDNASSHFSSAIGLLEVQSWSASMAALDAASKAGDVAILQAELNDQLGVLMKLAGNTAAVRAALDAAKAVADAMKVRCLTDLIAAPAAEAHAAIMAKPEFNPLMEQSVVHDPDGQASTEIFVSDQASYAIGMIETQGYTAVIEAIDTACKAADVQVVGREKLGGGYITVVIRGDVAAVRAAIDAGKAKVEGLGKLIAAHIIPRPSGAVLALMPK